jgi:putative sterol carrier protein
VFRFPPTKQGYRRLDRRPPVPLRSAPTEQEAVVTDKYPFLSDAWFDAADKIIKDNAPAAPPTTNLVMNLEVTSGEDLIKFHMGAKDGETLFGKGERDGADITMSTDIDTAREVFVSGNPQAGMQAFMSGKIRVQGDMMKMMTAQASGGGTPDLSKQLQDITE